jgi:DNA-binding NarL/FixJ family response regulator
MELVGAVASGKEGVQAFTEHRPDVTLMDLDLPSATGIKAIQEILRIDPATCVLGLMTYEEDEADKHAMRAGARSCITKDRLNEDPVSLIRDCPRREDWAARVGTGGGDRRRNQWPPVPLLWYAPVNRSVTAKTSVFVMWREGRSPYFWDRRNYGVCGGGDRDRL